MPTEFENDMVLITMIIIETLVNNITIEDRTAVHSDIDDDIDDADYHRNANMMIILIMILITIVKMIIMMMIMMTTDDDDVGSGSYMMMVIMKKVDKDTIQPASVWIMRALQWL